MVHPEYGRQIARGWEPLPRSDLAIGDGPSDLGCNLLVERKWVARVHLTRDHSTAYTSTK